jgi:hypothetical protein
VQPFERVVLVVDDLAELLGGGPHRLLEEGEQQLVLAGEVLVEAPQRLAGVLDDLLDRELPVRGGLHELEGGVEEALHPLLRPSSGRVERTGHGELAPTGGGVVRRGVGHGIVHGHG